MVGKSVCRDCEGAGQWDNCDHGASCSCRGFRTSCATCEGTGVVPTVCVNCDTDHVDNEGDWCTNCLNAEPASTRGFVVAFMSEVAQ